MSLWGKFDTITVAGTVAVTNGSAAVVGTGTSFTSLVPGITVVVAGVKYKVRSIESNTAMTLTSNYTGTTASGLTITAQDAPKNLRFTDVRNVVFVDNTEAAVASNRAKGLKSPGWWKYTTHTTDGGSKTKHKAELLVALPVVAAVSGDANDDSIVADA